MGADQQESCKIKKLSRPPLRRTTTSCPRGLQSRDRTLTHGGGVPQRQDPGADTGRNALDVVLLPRLFCPGQDVPLHPEGGRQLGEDITRVTSITPVVVES